MEWTVMIEGRDELGEVQRAPLRIEKGCSGRLSTRNVLEPAA
jgi:hypothetical protein